ncbi:MAG: DUF4922 domain-containing protein [Melioribacteraceae bacterium]|nr:DUF4922 domain-containing protein [Melioribacteraceae bacterium]
MEVNSNIFLSDEELKKYTNEEDLATKAGSLLLQQKETWSLPQKGFSDLETVEVKELEFDGFKVKVQFNPGRITSSAAKVDAKTIKERKCFLCPAHLPKEQKALPFGSDYLILVNPFPIFPEHFTLPKIAHVDQLIKDNFDDMLNFAKALGKHYVLFYNGPKCGASAPDHMHYQAGSRNFMPIDYEYDSIIEKYGKAIHTNDNVNVYAVDKYLRNFISIESSDKLEILNVFNVFYEAFNKVSNSEIEPMMNIITSYQDNKWRVIIFPRENHRPTQFFEEGDKRILLSPASVDMGGVCITPLEEDFKKITKEDIADIFRQISVSKEKFEYLVKTLTDLFE